MRIPRPGARAGRAAVGVFLLPSAFLALPTGPATGDPEAVPPSASQSSLQPSLPGVTALMGDNPAEGLPGFNDLPANLSLSLTEGTVTSSQHAVARRAKMSITSRPIWGAMYFGEYNYPIENPTGYRLACNAFFKTPCLPDPFYQPPCATDDPATQWMTSYQRHKMYPIKPLKGGGADVGILTEEKINLVAFGSIPATATLTMSVPRVDGKVRPLQVHSWDRRGQGCAPLPSDLPRTSTVLAGEIVVQLSDLEVDGVPVDLGPRCRTEHPADLYVWGIVTPGDRENTYYPGSGGPLAAIDGIHPGSLGPLKHPYYYEDNGLTIPPSSGVDIPPFVNCGVGAEDLSPLVTAMASGPNNPVHARQSTIVAAANRIPLEDISMCTPGPIPYCPLPAPEIPERPPLPDGEGQ